MKERPCACLECRGPRWEINPSNTGNSVVLRLCWRHNNGPRVFFPQPAVFLLLSCKLQLRAALPVHVSTVGPARCDSVLCLGATAWIKPLLECEGDGGRRYGRHRSHSPVSCLVEENGQKSVIVEGKKHFVMVGHKSLTEWETQGAVAGLKWERGRPPHWLLRLPLTAPFLHSRAIIARHTLQHGSS